MTDRRGCSSWNEPLGSRGNRTRQASCEAPGFSASPAGNPAARTRLSFAGRLLPPASDIQRPKGDVMGVDRHSLVATLTVPIAAGVFILDVYTPHETAPQYLYVFPVLLTVWSSQERPLRGITALCVGLTWTGSSYRDRAARSEEGGGGMNGDAPISILLVEDHATSARV